MARDQIDGILEYCQQFVQSSLVSPQRTTSNGLHDDQFKTAQIASIVIQERILDTLNHR